MATTFSASLRPTRTRILLIAVAVALLLGYGLFTAQRARSATLAKKVSTGVKGSTATLVHPSHVIGISHPFTGCLQPHVRSPCGQLFDHRWRDRRWGASACR
jgi:hypothetical protein